MSGAVTVSVGGRAVTLTADALLRVGFAGAVTALPFVPDWIEGLISIDNRPVLQIDLGRALGGPGSARTPEAGDKIVVVQSAAGVIALRVGGLARSVDPTAPRFSVAAIIPGLVEPSQPSCRRVDAAPASAREPPNPAAIALVVTSGATRTGILIENGVSVGHVTKCVEVRTGDSTGHLVASINDRLLPARRLSAEGGTEHAVIGGPPKGEMAILVCRLIGLERIAVDRLMILPGAPLGQNLCFPMEGGDPVCLQDFATLTCDIGGGAAAGASYRALLERVKNRARETSSSPPAELSGWGHDCRCLMVEVRGVRWLIPLELVVRMLGVDERQAIVPDGPGGHGVPLFDAARWFSPASLPLSKSRLAKSRLAKSRPAKSRPAKSEPAETLLMRSANQTLIALRVDRIALEDPGNTAPWLPPPALPLGLARLVAAVRADPVTGRWCLRLESGLDLKDLPYLIRRAGALALLGRLAPGVTP